MGIGSEFFPWWAEGELRGQYMYFISILAFYTESREIHILSP